MPEQKTDNRDAITSELLGLFNSRTDVQPLLERVVALLKNHTGMDAVGIRVLDRLGNIPYIAHDGFPADFIAREGPLCVTRDRCACIYISKGEVDRKAPYYTNYGSFHSSNLQDFQVLKDGMMTGEFRGECMLRGWETLFLAPIRFGHRYFGLIQSVSRKRDGLSDEYITFIENTAGQIGLYLHGVYADEDREREFNHLLRRIMHDLKTPLVSTAMLTEEIQDSTSGALTPELSMYMERVANNADYMLKLVSSLSSLHQSCGPDSNDLETVNLKKFVEGVVSDMGGELTGVKVTVSDSLPTVECSWVCMRRLMTNLISNAVKYRSQEREPAVTISAEEKDTFYQITVSDNGMGMDEAEVEYVFLPFYRTKGASKLPGSGLGLSICKRIVEAGGGKIWVYSSPGKGSDFHFTIPKTATDR